MNEPTPELLRELDREPLDPARIVAITGLGTTAQCNCGDLYHSLALLADGSHVILLRTLSGLSSGALDESAQGIVRAIVGGCLLTGYSIAHQMGFDANEAMRNYVMSSFDGVDVEHIIGVPGDTLGVASQRAAENEEAIPRTSDG